MKHKLTPLILAAGLLFAGGHQGHAAIKSVSFEEMCLYADQCVAGTIVNKVVREIDTGEHGIKIHTWMTIEGENLESGRKVSIDVMHRGGILDAERGIGQFSSEAPSAQDTELGSRVVVFTKFADDIGGGVSSNLLAASHGGLFRTLDGPSGLVVLGRGDGYAIPHNTKIGNVREGLRNILKQNGAKKIQVK